MIRKAQQLVANREAAGWQIVRQILEVLESSELRSQALLSDRARTPAAMQDLESRVGALRVQFDVARATLRDVRASLEQHSERESTRSIAFAARTACTRFVIAFPTSSKPCPPFDRAKLVAAWRTRRA